MGQKPFLVGLLALVKVLILWGVLPVQLWKPVGVLLGAEQLLDNHHPNMLRVG